MQPYVPVPNVVQAELRQRLGGVDLMNVLYFKMPAPIAVGPMITLGGALADWWENSFSAQLSSNLNLVEVYLTDLTSQTGPTASVVTGLPHQGNVVQESMSGNVAACISFKTGSRGRSFQGRNYIAGLPITAVLLNIIDASVLLALQAAYEELLGWQSTLGADHVVVSRFSGYTIVGAKKIPTPRTTGLATPVLTYKFTTDSVRTQRDRLP